MRKKWREKIEELMRRCYNTEVSIAIMRERLALHATHVYSPEIGTCRMCSGPGVKRKFGKGKTAVEFVLCEECHKKLTREENIFRIHSVNDNIAITFPDD